MPMMFTWIEPGGSWIYSNGVEAIDLYIVYMDG